ncbi:hypothetical protein BCR39DRAFT_536430 [Naematelia encephala]|uniref:Enoyl reductase (ER) domain-containing protein n=1 Tax=Naematelia encephala TaxID=71784 RepID=A0A1Y2AZQ2_9TREE|nr:hypothetical protein BCR39DRAFT_536430 [Naematelia encephala]
MSLIPTDSQRLVLHKRPERGPVTDETFSLESISIPDLKDGEVLVRVEYVSIDATMRNWLNPTRSYMRPVEIGEVMRAGGIGRVVASRAKGFVENDLVFGTLGWQEYWLGPAKHLEHRQTPRGGKDIDHLGLFGISGMTAYFGIFDIGRLKDGEKVVISGAAGSVGLIVTQIAIAHPKCTVIAIAGTPDKCAELEKLGCHTVLNYRDPNFRKAFKKVGLIDVYFDNVGGEILDMVLAQLNPHARIVCCGAISQYNAKTPYPLTNTPSLIAMKASMTGFIAFEYAARYSEATTYLAELQSKGSIKYEYHLLEPRQGERNGLGRCTEGMEVVYQGKNYGKTLVKISGNQQSSKL